MHYNVQVHIQQVQEPENLDDRQPGRSPSHTERKVIEVLSLKISASTEAEAYERAVKILTLNNPPPVEIAAHLLPENHSNYRPL